MPENKKPSGRLDLTKMNLTEYTARCKKNGLKETDIYESLMMTRSAYRKALAEEKALAIVEDKQESTRKAEIEDMLQNLTDQCIWLICNLRDILSKYRDDDLMERDDLVGEAINWIVSTHVGLKKLSGTMNFLSEAMGSERCPSLYKKGEEMFSFRGDGERNA